MDEPKFEQLETLYIVGFSKRFRPETMSEVPKLWEDYAKGYESIPNKFGHSSYGLSYGFSDDGEMSYMAGAEVEHLDDVPEGMTGLRLDPQSYAVFQHEGHVSEMGASWMQIFKNWFPKNQERILRAVPMFERYGEEFNPESGMGKVALFVPVK